MKVLIACEESQRVCIAFREKGHEAYSCDTLPCSGGHPEWHIQDGVLPLINGGVTFKTQDGKIHAIEGIWDLIIAHPPCTYLTVTGNRWFNRDKYFITANNRYIKRLEAINFFMEFVFCNAKRVVIENPVGIMSGVYRAPDQIIHPYMFGDAAEKKTCLWLKGVSPLKETMLVEPPKRISFKSGKSMPKWYADAWHLPKEERERIRSKTFKGIAKAMAEQWG